MSKPRGSHRKGVTRALHEQTRVQSTTRFSCDLCPPTANTWTVGPREVGVMEAQAAHRATHMLAHRIQVEALAEEYAGVYTQALR
jgi:hypothetical protein